MMHEDEDEFALLRAAVKGLKALAEHASEEIRNATLLVEARAMQAERAHTKAAPQAGLIGDTPAAPMRLPKAREQHGE